MKIHAINFKSEIKNNFNYVKTTGYTTLALGTASIIQAGRHKTKSHKILSCLTAISSIIHVGIIEYYRLKNK